MEGGLTLAGWPAPWGGKGGDPASPTAEDTPLGPVARVELPVTVNVDMLVMHAVACPP